MSLRVGVRQCRPLILRNRAGLVQILSAHTAWMFLKEEGAADGWKTLCKNVRGATDWLPVKRLARFRRVRRQAFQELQTPEAQVQALHGKDATVLSCPDQDREPVQGFEQLEPLRGIDLQDVLDLEPELSAGMHSFSCSLPFSCMKGSSDPSASENFGNMELKYVLGSAPLLALTRVAAAYVANARVSKDGRRLGTNWKLAPDDTTIMLLGCRQTVRDGSLLRELQKDVITLTSDSRSFLQPQTLATYTPSIIATLVLLCGYLRHVRVPSFILNGDEVVRREFFQILNRINGIPSHATNNLVYKLTTCAAAGVSYMLAQRAGKNKVFISNAGGRADLKKLVAFSEEDPFSRATEPVDENAAQLLYPSDRFAYAIEVSGSEHFVDGLSRVPISNIIAAPSRHELPKTGSRPSPKI